MKNTYNNTKIIIFIITLAILFVGAVVHKPLKFSESENRYLAERPVLTLDKLLDGTYMKDYESFITDQFPKRNFFRGIKTFIERSRGRTDDNGVYFGKGYLIGKYDGALFESETAKKNISTLSDFVKMYGNSFGKEHLQIALVPSSSEILKDKLPRFASTYNQTNFIKNIKAAVGGDYVVDLGETLKDKGKDYIYYRTDHHWTTKGAYYGYCDIIKHLNGNVSNLDEFKADIVSSDFLGTYDSKVNTSDIEPDTITVYRSKEIDKATMLWDEKKKFDSIYNDTALKGKDKYSVFFGGNHALTDIKTGLNDKTLLLIKDSFAHSLAPFFLKNYGRIIMIDLRYFNRSLRKYLSENKITDILVIYSTPSFVEDANLGRLLR